MFMKNKFGDMTVGYMSYKDDTLKDMLQSFPSAMDLIEKMFACKGKVMDVSTLRMYRLNRITVLEDGSLLCVAAIPGVLDREANIIGLAYNEGAKAFTCTRVVSYTTHPDTPATVNDQELQEYMFGAMYGHNFVSSMLGQKKAAAMIALFYGTSG